MSQQAKPDAGLLRFLVHEVLIARDPGDAKVVEPQLALDGISVGFGQREVLVGATASFSSGVHVLFGVNGAGKSTLFRAVAGLVKASSGSVTYQGRDEALRLAEGPGPSTGRDSDGRCVPFVRFGEFAVT